MRMTNKTSRLVGLKIFIHNTPTKSFLLSVSLLFLLDPFPLTSRYLVNLSVCIIHLRRLFLQPTLGDVMKLGPTFSGFWSYQLAQKSSILIGVNQTRPKAGQLVQNTTLFYKKPPEKPLMRNMYPSWEMSPKKI